MERIRCSYQKRAIIRWYGTCLRLYSQKVAGSSELQTTVDSTEEEFRVFQIPGRGAADLPILRPRQISKSSRRDKDATPMNTPRAMRLKPTQDWTDVWPSASSFKWSVVPLALRQGYVGNKTHNDGIVPGKYANLELMKIPNFLHLTPNHIRKHCGAIKDLCTEWPALLTNDDLCRKYFPVEIITKDYCYAGPSIRDDRSRKVTFQVDLSSIDLDFKSRKKLVDLAGDRYDKKTNLLTITSDSCPTRKQNYDFIQYMFAVLYAESKKREAWEEEQSIYEMGYYDWQLHPSKTSFYDLVTKWKKFYEENGTDNKTHSDLIKRVSEHKPNCPPPEVEQFAFSVTSLCEDGDSIDRWEEYRLAVSKILNLDFGSKFEPEPKLLRENFKPAPPLDRSLLPIEDVK